MSEVIQFISCPAKRFRVIADHAARSLLDSLAKLRDTLARFGFGLAGFIGKAAVEQLLRCIQRLVRLLLSRLPNGVIQLLGKQRFRRFCFLDRLAHILHQLIQLRLLLLKILHDLLPFATVTKRRSLRRLARLLRVGLRILLRPTWRGKIGQLLRKLLLLRIQLTRIVAKLVHRICKLSRCFLAELIAKIVELLTRSRPGGRGIRYALLIECFRCLAHFIARLLELLARFRHSLLVFRLIHSIAQRIGVPQLLLLLVAQTGQLALKVFALSLFACLLQCRLDLTHLAIEIFLPLRQFTQAIEHLACFTLGGVLVRLLLGGCVALRFVAVLLLLKVKLIELPLPAIARLRALLSLLLLLTILSRYFKFAGPQL